MEKVKVNVTHNKKTGFYLATCNSGRYHLCLFEKSKITENGWYFRDSLTKNVKFIVEDKPFPLEFCINLIKASWFFEFGVKDFPEIEFTKAAQKLLKIQ